MTGVFLLAMMSLPTVKVRVAADIVDMPLERYVAAALAGEGSVFQSPEALKAMAVAARTYAIKTRGRHSKEGFELCDTAHCQRLDLHGITARLEKAAADTSGEFLWYKGVLAFTPYTRDCGGMTEDAANVWPDQAAPYLKGHVDPYCRREPWQWSADPREIDRALDASELKHPHETKKIGVVKRTNAGRATELVLQGGQETIPLSASSFRFAMGRELSWKNLPSDLYELHGEGGRITFRGTGAGHGVGMCQGGADRAGASGKTYREILAFYYPGTAVGITGVGLAWQTVPGQMLSMTSTQPVQDRFALSAAEIAATKLVARTHWMMPPRVELRVYPSVETFRNATGEPGWVAGHTFGWRIHLQPLPVLHTRAILDTTLTHELAHILIQSRARPGLPLWFHEGLAAYLAGERRGVPRMPADAELRDPQSSENSRRAYADATAMVARMVADYQEAAVLDFVSRGIPPEVFKANASQAAPKNK